MEEVTSSNLVVPTNPQMMIRNGMTNDSLP